MKLRRAAAVTVLALTVSGAAYAANDWQDIAFVSSTAGVSSRRLCMGAPGNQRPADIGCPSYSPYLTSGGLLGIGTTSPTTALNVVYNGNALGVLGVQNTSDSGYSDVYFRDSSGTDKGAIGYANSSAVLGANSIF